MTADEYKNFCHVNTSVWKFTENFCGTLTLLLLV